MMSRVKATIAVKGGMTDVSIDGFLKANPPKADLKSQYQREFAKHCVTSSDDDADSDISNSDCVVPSQDDPTASEYEVVKQTKPGNIASSEEDEQTVQVAEISVINTTNTSDVVATADDSVASNLISNNNRRDSDISSAGSASSSLDIRIGNDETLRHRSNIIDSSNSFYEELNPQQHSESMNQRRISEA